MIKRVSNNMKLYRVAATHVVYVVANNMKEAKEVYQEDIIDNSTVSLDKPESFKVTIADIKTVRKDGWDDAALPWGHMGIDSDVCTMELAEKQQENGKIVEDDLYHWSEDDRVQEDVDDD